MTKTSRFRNRLKKSRKSTVQQAAASKLKLVPRHENSTDHVEEATITPFTAVKAVDTLISAADTDSSDTNSPKLFLLTKPAKSVNKQFGLGGSKGDKQVNMLSPKGMSKTERVKQNRVWSSRKDS